MNTSAADVHVLVTFYSRGGLTERLAVLIAEGAIQGGASIRLRRARDLAPENIVAAVPGWRESRDRMHAEYAEPRIADAQWAHAIAFGTPMQAGATSAELDAFLRELAGHPGSCSGRIASAFTSSYAPGAARDATEASLQADLLKAGFIVAPPRATETPGLQNDYDHARAQGRWLAHLARAIQAMGIEVRSRD